MLPYLGMQYPLRIFDAEDGGYESFSFSKSKFIVKSKSKEHSMIRALYKKWLENRVASILRRKVNEYSYVLKIDRVKLRINIKSQKNRLGSLGRKLTLLRLPPKIIDYVVIHELCHTKVPNHSPAYWHIVGLVSFLAAFHNKDIINHDRKGKSHIFYGISLQQYLHIQEPQAFQSLNFIHMLSQKI